MTAGIIKCNSSQRANPGLQVVLKNIILLSLALLLNACSSNRPLMPTPDVYALGMKQPFADSLSAELQSEK